MRTFQSLFAPPRHMILLGHFCMAGSYLAERRTEKHGISKDDLNNITFYGLVAFVIGGRISYVLQNISAFTKSPLGIISINPELFDLFGALVAAFIVTTAYGQRKSLRVLERSRRAHAILRRPRHRVGIKPPCRRNCVRKTNLPWGIDLWNATRHPTQLYDTLASSLILILLLWRFKPNPHPGILFLTFAALTALSQLVTHAFRADRHIHRCGSSSGAGHCLVCAGSFLRHDRGEAFIVQTKNGLTRNVSPFFFHPIQVQARSNHNCHCACGIAH
jgi:phosphatidylglycerol---prolipoprotein diacylglyceryl transferase